MQITPCNNINCYSPSRMFCRRYTELPKDTVCFGSTRKLQLPFNTVFNTLLNDENVDDDTFYNELMNFVYGGLSDSKLKRKAKQEFFTAKLDRDGSTPIHKIIDANIDRSSVIKRILKDEDLQDSKIRKKLLGTNKNIFTQGKQLDFNANILEYAALNFHSNAFAAILASCSFQEKEELLLKKPFMSVKYGKNMTEFVKNLYKNTVHKASQRNYETAEMFAIVSLWQNILFEPFELLQRLEKEKPSDKLLSDVEQYFDRNNNNLLQHALLCEDKRLLSHLIKHLETDKDKKTLLNLFNHRNLDGKKIQDMLDASTYSSLLNYLNLSENDIIKKSSDDIDVCTYDNYLNFKYE